MNKPNWLTLSYRVTPPPAGQQKECRRIVRKVNFNGFLILFTTEQPIAASLTCNNRSVKA